jgi:hypothetical protein
MVLCPEFLPRDQAPAAPARAVAPAAVAAPTQPVAPAPARTPGPLIAPVRERLSGTLQYVFGDDPGFSMDETFGGTVDAVESEESLTSRAPGVETHHL